MSCIYNMHNVSVASDISDYTPYRYKYTPVGYIPSRGMFSQAHAHAYTHTHMHTYTQAY